MPAIIAVITRILCAMFAGLTILTSSGHAVTVPQRAPAVTCYAPNPDAGVCVGNLYIAS
jgi:hypothetical protein